MTSAPRTTDIGFSGIRSAKSTSADQPGGQGDRQQRHERALPRAEGGEEHERDRGQAGEQRPQPPPRRGDRRVGLGRQHRQAGQLGVDPGGRVQAVAHAVDDLLLAVERHEADAEGQRRRAPVGA